MNENELLERAAMLLRRREMQLYQERGSGEIEFEETEAFQVAEELEGMIDDA